MAAPIILFNPLLAPMSEVLAALQMIRNGVTRLGNARLVQIAECSGTTDTASHFARLATQGGFQQGDYADVSTAAMQSFLQVDSVYSILTKPSGQGDAAGAAIAQACAYHGI